MCMLSGLSKDDFENLFSSCHEVNFRKKHVLAIFRIIFQKNLTLLVTSSSP